MQDILLFFVKGAGKQMPQIMGIYFFLWHSSFPAQLLHRSPHIAPVHGPSTAGNKNRAVRDPYPCRIVQKDIAKLLRDQDHPALAFIFCNSVSTHCRLNCNILQLTDPDPSSAQRQDQEVQTDLFFPPGCLQKAPIFLPPQLLSLVTKSLVLQLEQLDAAFPCPDKFQKLIHCSQHGICAAHRVPLSQPIFISNDLLLPEGAFPLLKGQEHFDIMHIFSDRRLAFFIQLQISAKGFQCPIFFLKNIFSCIF